MDLNGVKYDAFISYRHSPVDMYIAKSIHKRLENFKLPKSVIDKVVANGKKTKIERVFRDQDELPLADNLSDPIDVALTNSDHLIVICTPRLPQSQWCRKEITTFIKKHDRDHVLAVLAEGEPYESFPYELTHEEITITNPDGSTTTEIRELEPLAADVRGKNKHETEKMLDDATVRLCAGIFELNYDDLKQRHKEQQTKKRVRILAGIAGAMFVFSMVCMALLLTINSQKKTIDSQYDEIQSQYTQIQDQYVKIEEQYSEIQEKYEDAMGTSAEKLLDEGRKKDALYALLHAIDQEDCKPGTEFLLSLAMNLYGVDGRRAPSLAYDMDSNVEEMKVNDEGSRIILKGGSGELVVFDTATGERVYAAKTTDNNYTFLSFEEEVFASENAIYYVDNGKLSYCDIENKKGSYVLDTVDSLFGNEKMGVTIAFSEGVIYGFDPFGKQIYSVALEDLSDEDFFPELSYLEDLSFSPDQKKAVLNLWYSGSDNMLLVLDVTTGDVISCFLYENSLMNKVGISNDSVYLMTSDGSYTQISESINTLYAYNLYTLELLWSICTTDHFYNEISANEGLVLLSANNSCIILDATNGETIGSWDEFPTIIDASVNSPERAFIACNDGEIYAAVLGLDDALPMSGSLYSYMPDNKIMDIAIRKGDIYFMFSGEKYVSKYSANDCEIEYPEYEAPEEYLDFDYSFGTEIKFKDGLSKTAYTSSDGKYTFSRQYDGTIVVFDSDNNIRANIYDFAYELDDVLYIEELDRYILKSFGSSFLLDENFQITHMFGNVFDYEDGYFIVRMNEKWYKVPYYSTKDVITRAWEELGDYVPSKEIAAKYGIKLDEQ